MEKETEVIPTQSCIYISVSYVACHLHQTMSYAAAGAASKTCTMMLEKHLITIIGSFMMQIPTRWICHGPTHNSLELPAPWHPTAEVFHLRADLTL